LKTVARELGKCNLDFVGVQEVGWDKGRGHWTGRGLYIFIWTGELGSLVRNRFFVHKKIVPSVRRVEFISDRVSYRILRSLEQYYFSEFARSVWGWKWWQKGQPLYGNRGVSLISILGMIWKLFGQFQRESRQLRYFQTDNREPEFTRN
jgi:hypothetical protein